MDKKILFLLIFGIKHELDMFFKGYSRLYSQSKCRLDKLKLTGCISHVNR